MGGNFKIGVLVRTNQKMSLLQKAACVNTFMLGKFGYYNCILSLSKVAADASRVM